MFADISNIEHTNDYLPLLNGCITAELTVVFLCVYGFFVSGILRKWYKAFQLTAFIFDISTMMIIIILARYLYKKIFKKFDFLYFLGLVIVLQIIYCFLFYVFVNHYWLKNDIFIFQQNYIAEISFVKYLFYSIFIMTMACSSSAYFAVTSMNSNIFNLILSFFFYSFMINEV